VRVCDQVVFWLDVDVDKTLIQRLHQRNLLRWCKRCIRQTSSSVCWSSSTPTGRELFVTSFLKFVKIHEFLTIFKFIKFASSINSDTHAVCLLCMLRSTIKMRKTHWLTCGEKDYLPEKAPEYVDPQLAVTSFLYRLRIISGMSGSTKCCGFEFTNVVILIQHILTIGLLLLSICHQH